MNRAISYFNGLRPWLIIAGYCIGMLTGTALVGYPAPWWVWLTLAPLLAACIVADFQRATAKERQ